MKMIAILVACSVLTVPTAASAMTPTDFQDCSNTALDNWHNQMAYCNWQYENGYFGVAGQIERDECQQQAYDNYGYDMDICRQFYPEGASYVPEKRYTPLPNV